MLLRTFLAGLRSELEEVGFLRMLRSPSAFLWLEKSVGIYFPLKSRQEDRPCRGCVRYFVSNLGVEGVCGHPRLQDAPGSLRRVGHLVLRFPVQPNLDCLAALLLSSSTAENRRAWELSRLAAGHRGAAPALTTRRPTYTSRQRGTAGPGRSAWRSHSDEVLAPACCSSRC